MSIRSTYRPTGVPDGDKGDITTASGGTSWTIDTGVVSTSKLGGDVTTAGKALLDDADASAQRTTLGLGTAATSNTTAFEAAGAVSTHAAITSSVHGISTFGATLVDDADAATARSTLGLVIGTNVQAYDAELAALAGLTSAADKLPYFTGSGTAAVADFSAAGRALVDDADAAAMRTTLGLAIGTNVQAYDADLTTWAGLTPSANAQSFVTAANYAAMRALLDLEAGTDFYSIAAADAAFQPKDTQLTSLAALSYTGNALKVVRVNAGETDFELASGGAGLSDGDTLSTGLTFPNTGLKINDTNGSHSLIVAPGSDITANRTLTITTGDADRTLTLSGNATLSGGTHSGTNTGDQDLSSYATTAAVAAGYQPLDTQLTSLAGLSYSSNAGKVIAVNGAETGFELVAAGGGSYLSSSTTSTQAGYFSYVFLDDNNSAYYLGLSFNSDIANPLTANRTIWLETYNSNRTIYISGDTTLAGGNHSGTNTGDNPGVTSVATSGLATGGTITGTGTITVTAATQSDQETATSTTTAVTPGRQQYHPSACKCWADINATSTTPNASYNVTSVTNDAGETVITINVDFSSANYAVVAAVERNNNTTTVTSAKSVVIKSASQAAGSVTLQCWDATATNNVIEDPTSFYMCAFGDQ